MIPIKITIVRHHSGGEDPDIRIELHDEASGCLIAECSMALEAFALAVTGQARIPGMGHRMPTPEVAALLGRQRRGRTIYVDRPTSYDNKADELASIIDTNPECIAARADGWQLSSDGGRERQDRVKWATHWVRWDEAHAPTPGRDGEGA